MPPGAIFASSPMILEHPEKGFAPAPEIVLTTASITAAANKANPSCTVLLVGRPPSLNSIFFTIDQLGVLKV